MKAISIAFARYRRLRDAKCNTDGKLIAFLGPNEAGKSSVLTALDWFSNGEGALPTTDWYRPNKPLDSDVVVTVKYRLLDDHRKAIDDLGLAVNSVPDTITVTKTAGGQRRLAEWGQVPTRDPSPFRTAIEKLESLGAKLASSTSADVDDDRLATIQGGIDGLISLPRVGHIENRCRFVRIPIIRIAHAVDLRIDALSGWVSGRRM